MSTKVTGQCLCGAVSFIATDIPLATVNCHCTECRRATGAVYGTVLYYKQDAVTITGAVNSFEHQSDRGTGLTKQFCSECGSQLFALADAWPDWIGIRAGCIDQASAITPERNVFVDSKIQSTPLDPNLPTMARMP